MFVLPFLSCLLSLSPFCLCLYHNAEVHYLEITILLTTSHSKDFQTMLRSLKKTCKLFQVLNC